MAKKYLLIFVTVLLFANNITSAQTTSNYMSWLNQINANAIHNEGLTGKGIKIGVIDAGFRMTDEIVTTKWLFDNNQIVFAQNYVNDTCSNVFKTKSNHGLLTLTRICGNQNDTMFFGVANDAEFYLARTEFGKKDYREEEENFEKAVEEMYNQGVRLINVSLSYTDNFEKKDEAYSTEEIDGKTAYITKVCDKWADKGIIFVVGSGNKGLSKWKILGAPADAENVITVGATGPRLLKIDEITEKTAFKAGFSSIGSENLSYIKPEIALYSGWGTSFCAPVITGIVACMLQFDNTLTLFEIKEILIKSSNLYPCPNNFIGYGVPDCNKIIELLKNPNYSTNNVEILTPNENKIEIETNSDDIVVFHKKNKNIVIKQKRVKSKNGKVIIKRKKNVQFSTVCIGTEKTYEIKWEN